MHRIFFTMLYTDENSFIDQIKLTTYAMVDILWQNSVKVLEVITPLFWRDPSTV